MPQAPEPDELLVARARRGDAGAFGLLAERYQDAVFNGIYRMVGQREDAEDLAQEVFVKAYGGIGRFEGRSSLYTWLYSIAFNVVVSHRRKVGSSRHANPLSLQESGDEAGRSFDVQDGSERPDAAAERGELREQIEEAIGQLEEDHRVVLVMRDIEGFDYDTIARLLGCPHGTVKSRLHRARLALREQLKDLVG
jgi:RNA polymerase sigma-70 factor (ECF subfamily)